MSGHSITDGPTEVTEPEKTASSRALVQEFVELIMMGGDRSQIRRFFDGDHFVQHNPQIADGVSGLGEAIQTGVWAAVVERTHRVLADGEFVFTQGEGTLQDRPTVFYDLSGYSTASSMSTGTSSSPNREHFATATGSFETNAPSMAAVSAKETDNRPPAAHGE